MPAELNFICNRLLIFDSKNNIYIYLRKGTFNMFFSCYCFFIASFYSVQAYYVIVVLCVYVLIHLLVSII